MNIRMKRPVNSYSAPELEVLILRLRRDAVHRHLSIAEWRRVDRLRKRRAQLLKEVA
jgi:hypothetical protein